MINQENIKAILNSLTMEQLREFEKSDKDCVCLILHVFNAGFKAELKFSTFVSDFEDELDNGNIACDKDEFMANMNFYGTKKWIKLQAEA